MITNVIQDKIIKLLGQSKYDETLSSKSAHSYADAVDDDIVSLIV